MRALSVMTVASHAELQRDHAKQKRMLGFHSSHVCLLVMRIAILYLSLLKSLTGHEIGLPTKRGTDDSRFFERSVSR